MVDQVGKPFAVGKVPVVKEQPRSGVVGVPIDLIDPTGVERAGPADRPVDLIALG